MVDAILAQLAEQLKHRHLPYMVIGGQAVLVYGEPRLTRDIDVTLGVGLERLQEVLDLAAASGWRVMLESPRVFVERTLVLPCEDPATGVRFDFVFGLSPYELEAIGRARAVRIAGVEVMLAAPEDLIIHKLLAGRPRDLEDITGMLRKRIALDHEYLERKIEVFDRDLGTALRARWQTLQSS